MHKDATFVSQHAKKQRLPMHEFVESTFCSEAYGCNIPLQNSVTALISTVRSKSTLKQVARPTSHISWAKLNAGATKSGPDQAQALGPGPSQPGKPTVYVKTDACSSTCHNCSS
jgi:hypothetical protein